MSGAFKKIASRNVTTHTAHKSYKITITNYTGSFDGVNVYAYDGAPNTSEYGVGSVLTTNGYAKRDIYDSIRTNFYIDHGQYTGQTSRNLIDENIVKGLPTTPSGVCVIAIPQLMKGDRLKPGSIKVTASGVVYEDDSEGNLSFLSIHFGNIFYDEGFIIVNNSTIFSNCILEFKNTHVIEEREYSCNISKDEFNASSNLTLLDHPTGSLRSFTSSSAFNPYITTVGLYDDDNNLLALGKLGQPIKKSEDYDTTFVIRFDT